MDITLRSKDIELTEDLKSFAQKKIGGLDKYFDKVLEIRVELCKETEHHKQGNIYKAAVECEVPGKVLYSSASAEDIKTAVNQVKNEMQKVISEYKGHNDSRRREAAKEVRAMKEEAI